MDHLLTRAELNGDIDLRDSQERASGRLGRGRLVSTARRSFRTDGGYVETRFETRENGKGPL